MPCPHRFYPITGVSADDTPYITTLPGPWHGPDVLVAVADPLDACIAIWKPLKDVLPNYWMTAFPEEISPGWSQ